MGQKVNPIGLRVGINRTWDSRWFADKGYAGLLHEDLRLRKYLQERLVQAGVSRVIIERPTKKARITIHTARPGVVIGTKGADSEKLQQIVLNALERIAVVGRCLRRRLCHVRELAQVSIAVLRVDALGAVPREALQEGRVAEKIDRHATLSMGENSCCVRHLKAM